MELYFLSVLVFILVLMFLIYRDRKNIEIHYILLIKRTKIGLKILDGLARPKIFWKVFGTFGILLAFFLMFEGFSSLISYSKLLLTGAVRIPGLSFVLPSFRPDVESGPGYLLLPFWLWLIVIASVIVPHELLHGIMSRVEKIRVKSVGVLLLLVLPGAFVEPDDKQLKKSRFISKLRVFASGSLANFIVYFLIFNFTSKIIWPYFVPGPIILREVNATGPAARAGLKPNMVITEMNKKLVKLTYEEFLIGSRYLYEETRDLKPGDEISIIANGTEFKLVLGANPENESLPYLGIVYSPITRDDRLSVGFVFQLFTWMWIINYAVAVFNIMPLYPLDGGMIVLSLMEKINKKHARKITLMITAITIGILAFTFIVPFLLQATPQPS
ncbi:MAG: site-2 protease family protein [Candidatus Aenigmatarchaeota archaeon]